MNGHYKKYTPKRTKSSDELDEEEGLLMTVVSMGTRKHHDNNGKWIFQ